MLDPRGYQQQESEKGKDPGTGLALRELSSTDFNGKYIHGQPLNAFVASDWKPFAQEVINYTPKGTRTNLKLTVATDIQTTKNEYEV